MENMMRIVWTLAVILFSCLFVFVIHPTFFAYFDYPNADEESQQSFLDGTADGLKASFLVSGFRGEMESIRGDAARDQISFTIRHTEPHMDHIKPHVIESRKRSWMRDICPTAKNQHLLDYGITIEIKFKRPNHSKLMNVTVNSETCADYIP